MMRSAYLTYLMMALTVVVGCGDETIHDTVVKVSGQHSLEVGNTLALSAETLNGTDTSYTWSSGDTTIATVDGSGVVTAIAVGETSITATGDSTKVAGAHALVVVGAGSVQVVVSGQHAVEVGKTLALSASTQNGTDGSYLWNSSDATVASVDTAGQVTGVAVGEVTISAKGGDTGISGQHTVVVVPVGSALVEITGTLSVVVHKTSKLTATTKGGSDTGYTWASDKPEVATVGADGTVTGVSNGQVIITAEGKDSGAKGSIGLVVSDEIPNYDKWLTSGHADRKAEAFNHWNTSTPAEVPTTCAKCHSTPGFRDFIGEDGSAVDAVDKAAAIGTVVECTACHNKAADALSHVVFPSGVKLENLGPESRCMTCHQGRESTDSVEKAITTAAPATDDTVSTSLSFKNVHYYAAAATLNAGRVRGGYQYTGKTYDYRFRHANKVDTCVDCHDAHTLQVKLDDCKTCHAGVTTTADLKQIRMIDSSPDFNGNGNTTEGIYDEMMGLRALLLKALQGYVTDQSLSKICYNGGTYPYWFKDTDGDGTCSATEAVSANGFAQWTARLLRGAYNYQVSTKDPGAFAHNAKYIIQLLYDSVEDLNKGMTTSKVDLSLAVRNDIGHFNGAGEPARHWDTDDAVSADCSKCHGGSDGLRFFVKYGVGNTVDEPDNGLDCYTCHETFGTTWTTMKVDKVTYPSGKTITATGAIGNICSTCHSGRESKATIDAKIAANSLSFRNVHYLPAAAIKNGSDAQVGYEYPTKTYAKAWKHTAGDDCTFCHDPKLSQHTFQAADSISKCTGCHTGVTKPDDIRMSLHNKDYDNDGSATEPLKDEIDTLAQAVLTGIQLSVAATSKICYSGASYPYWFKDTDGDGTCSATEAVSANGYGPWTATLMKAAHNYQITQKEPGAWAHNFDYMAELLIDTIEDLGGSTTGFIRP